MATKKLTSNYNKRKVKGKKKKPATKGRKRAKLLTPWIIAAVLVLAVISVLYPYIRSGRLASYGAKIPDGAKDFCLDISHYNEEIIWDSLKVVVDGRGRTGKDILKAKHIYPVSTVVIKATEGEKMTDPKFEEYWTEAGKREYARGAYHFFRTSKDPLSQASHYISHVRLRHSDLPPVLDVETLHRGCSREELNRNVLLWLETVEKHYGRKPIVYTSDSFARDILSHDITSRYPMWIARYNESPPRFGDWAYWQFTDKALLHGASGYVDLSVIR